MDYTELNGGFQKYLHERLLKNNDKVRKHVQYWNQNYEVDCQSMGFAVVL